MNPSSLFGASGGGWDQTESGARKAWAAPTYQTLDKPAPL